MPMSMPEEDTVPMSGIDEDHDPPGAPGVIATEEPAQTEAAEGVKVVPGVTVMVCVAAA